MTNRVEDLDRNNELATNPPPGMLPPLAEGKTPADRIMIQDGAYYAELEPAENVIKVFGQDGTQLFGLNPAMIAFEQKPLTVSVQLYVMAFQQGNKTGYESCKKKVEE